MVETIERKNSGSVKNSPPGEEVKKELQHIVNLVDFSEISSIRSIVTAIIRVINDPTSTVRELKDIILLDPPLAGRVLKTANSAYYSRSFQRTFVDVEQAIIWMGSEIIKELALNQKVCEIFDRDEQIEGYSRRALWRHSVAVAMLTRGIFRKEYGLKGENAYVAGLLHDIGIIAEDQFFQDDFKQILHIAIEKKTDISASELEYWGYDHAEIGHAIGESWGFPAELLSSIGFHHCPLLYRGEYSKFVSTLYAADFVCQTNGFAYGVVLNSGEKIFRKCLRIMDVKPYAIELIFKDVKKELGVMGDKGII